MMDSWSALGVVGGGAALSYIAAGRKTAKEGGEKTFRLSLDKGGSLVGDVRFLGGLLTLGGMYMAKEAGTKKALGVISLASFASLAITEAIRMRLKKDGTVKVADKLPVFPSFAWAEKAQYGALPGPNASYGNAGSYAGANAGWASR
jgi:hypothetical protein